MFNSFKNKVLSKSGQFNYYKSNFEKLTKNNPQLIESNDNNVIKELLSTARTFSNWKYIDYFFKDDFDEKFHNYLKNMSPESKRRFKLGFLRAIMGAYTYQNSLFSQEEIELNEKIKLFIEENVSDNKICDFDIIPGHYNINCFMEDYLTDSDKLFLKDKDIIDAGAFIGDSALPLSKLTSKNVYAFEPFDESFQKIEQNIELNNIDNIVPVKASLTDKNEDITLYLSGNNVEGITSNSSIRKYDTELVVKGMTIDKFVEENNLDVGFIKIDVEGGEQALLRGAINTIKTQKPIIYVSIYHTADDFFNIKPWIDNLNLGYEFEINKEKPYSFIADTVLECRVNENILSEQLKIKNAVALEYFDNYDYKFSVIMAVYNTEKFLKEAIDSVINQSIGFEDNIELILVDDGSRDSSGEICKQYQEKYSNNIKYIYQENQGQATARNNGMKIAKGAYLNFLDSDDKFSLNTFENVFNLIKTDNSADIVSVPIKFFDRETGSHVLNHKFKETKVADLFDDYDYTQLSASSAFVKYSAIENLDSNKGIFDTELLISEDAIFLNRILLNNSKLGVVKDGAYMYRKRSDLGSTIDKSTRNKKYYIHRTKNYFIALINESKEIFGFVPKFIQFTIMYELQWLFRLSYVQDVLNEDELDILSKDIHFVLKHIENHIILEQKQCDNTIKNIAFLFKNCERRFDTYKGLCRTWSGDKIIDKLNSHRFYIDSLEIKNGNFIVVGFLKSFFNSEDLDIEIVKKSADGLNEEIYAAKEVNYPFRDRKYLGKVFNKAFNFEIKVPLEEVENSILKLRVRFKDIEMYLSLVFQEWVNLSFESNYFLKDDYIVKFEDNEFIINNFNYSILKGYELDNILNIEILNREINNDELKEIIFIRKDYLKQFNDFTNRKIYLFMDSIDNADDNAEVLYNYAINQNDKIEKYFILSKDSKDYERLKKWGNLIEYGSYEHKMLYLFADKIISSHPDEEVLNPFYGKDSKYIAGLCTVEKYFIQHGITLHDVSYWLSRYDKHLSLISCAAKKEYESFFNYPYNYDEEVVQLLGFPRFDYLENNDDKKQIVIMPTWRRGLKGLNKEGFKSSDYCKKLSSLLSNEAFIKHAKDKGYAIIFKPHVNIMDYIDCFDINKYVDIDYSSKYRDIFNNSSMMITDYSSVAFDFAYLKKPLFYYHWNDDEFHFDIENSYFDYKEDGFGDIFENENDLVEGVIESINNNCKIEDKFVKRVNKFFEFIDKNNCKRVYEFLIIH